MIEIVQILIVFIKNYKKTNGKKFIYCIIFIYFNYIFNSKYEYLNI